MKKFAKKLIIVILLLFIGVSGYIAYELVETSKVDKNQKQEEVPVVEEPIEEKEEVVVNGKEGRYNYNEFYTINRDYKGHIYFESGIIDLPVVQGENNNSYYRTDWQTMYYDEEGSIFIDYRNGLDDQNVIIYGHNVAVSYEPSKTHKFTPLHLLEKEENYEKNKVFYLELEKEIREYEIAIVYRCKINEDENGNQTIIEDEPTFYYTSFTEEGLNTYLKKVKERSYYDTGVEIKYTDSMLTLQTCYEDSPDKLIVVAILKNTYTKIEPSTN